jgi:hypothetical protein
MGMRISACVRLSGGLLAVLVVLSTVRPALAGGSLDFEQVRQLLHEKPALEVLLTQTLQVEHSGMGVRLGFHWVHLGGLRIGPYTFKGKPRGKTGPDTLDITICTHVTFVDAKGRAIEGVDAAFETATDVREVVTAVILREAKDDKLGVCPG